METKRVTSPRGLLVGGNANNGANCGFAYLNSNNAPSNTNANIGSRLYLSKPKDFSWGRTLALAKR